MDRCLMPTRCLRPPADAARVRARARLLAGSAWMALAASAADTPGGGAGLHSDVVFSTYSPLARSSELLRRLLSPLSALRVAAEESRTGQMLREQPIDLANERFALYVPPSAPPAGYAVLVFVPPWPAAMVP